MVEIWLSCAWLVSWVDWLGMALRCLKSPIFDWSDCIQFCTVYTEYVRIQGWPVAPFFSELRQKGIDVLASVISWLMQVSCNALWWQCCWWILILSSGLNTWSSCIECCKFARFDLSMKIWACCSGHWQRCHRQRAAHHDGCDSKSLSYVQCQLFVCSLFDISCDIYVLCSMALLEETEKGSILLATQHGIIRQFFLPNLSFRGQLWGHLAVGREQLQRSSLWLCRQHWNDLKILP